MGGPSTTATGGGPLAAPAAAEPPRVLLVDPDPVGRAAIAGARRMLPKSDLGGLVAAAREEHAARLQAAYPVGGAGAGDTRGRG
jgi:hypothetical protein